MNTAAAKFFVKPAAEKVTVSYYSGKSKVVRGFYVATATCPFWRKFMQGSAQKWTPELEASLQAQAEAWAATLNQRAAA